MDPIGRTYSASSWSLPGNGSQASCSFIADEPIQEIGPHVVPDSGTPTYRLPQVDAYNQAQGPGGLRGLGKALWAKLRLLLRSGR